MCSRIPNESTVSAIADMVQESARAATKCDAVVTVVVAIWDVFVAVTSTCTIC